MKKVFIVLISVLTYFPLSAQIYTETYIKDSKSIAMEWLNNLNHMKFKTCWELHSDEAKIANQSFENWQPYVNELMKEFGRLKKRTVTDAYFQSSIEGKEDGFYVFIEYSCEYELTNDHVEVIVLKQDDQAKWKIDAWEYQFVENNQKKE